MTPRTVVVGTSVAGVRTARELRWAGYDGDIVLIGAETELPYDRPPLSKALLAGTVTPDEVRLLTEEAAAEAGIRLELGRAATGLDVAARTVELSDGTRLSFDDVVIATGAHARPAPWGPMEGVHTLRDLDDANALAADLRRGGPVAVVGTGFIGAEVAATARTMGLPEVMMVGRESAPLARSMPAELGERIARLHEGRGTRTRLGVSVTAVEPVRDGFALRFSDGTTLAAATVVVGIGALPNDGWLRDSGLRVDDGVVCDQFGRAAPHVYAVGDVARWFRPRHGRAIRVEHWTSASEQAACVAHNIVDSEQPKAHDGIEYVWSDQYDVKIQIVGQTGPGLVPVHLDRAGVDGAFAVLFAGPDGRLAGAVTVGWPRALATCRRGVLAANAVDEVRAALAA
jgi:phthalate 3,4-dioxygenase ferredoxin reductase subunit